MREIERLKNFILDNLDEVDYCQDHQVDKVLRILRNTKHMLINISKNQTIPDERLQNLGLMPGNIAVEFHSLKTWLEKETGETFTDNRAAAFLRRNHGLKAIRTQVNGVRKTYYYVNQELGA